MEKDRLGSLRAEIRAFASERDWDKFHTPKNLAMALSVEASELCEIFQWLTAEQSSALDEEQKARVAEEIGDVQIYLTRLADVLGLDPLECGAEKLKANHKKYPADLVRGSAAKYTAYDND